MHKRVRLWLASAGICVALVLLMVTAIRAATTYYYTLPQFRELGASAAGRFVKVNGTIGPSPHWDPIQEQLTFDVVAAAGQDGTPAPQGVAPLPVSYHGPEPDTFAAGISVVVAGRMLPSGQFQADQVLVKCPSHYTAASTTNA